MSAFSFTEVILSPELTLSIGVRWVHFTTGQKLKHTTKVTVEFCQDVQRPVPDSFIVEEARSLIAAAESAGIVVLQFAAEAAVREAFGRILAHYDRSAVHARPVLIEKPDPFPSQHVIVMTTPTEVAVPQTDVERALSVRVPRLAPFSVWTESVPEGLRTCLGYGTTREEAVESAKRFLFRLVAELSKKANA